MEKLIVIKRFSGFFDRYIYFVVGKSYNDSKKSIIQLSREAMVSTIHKNKAYSIAVKLNDINMKIYRSLS